MIFYLGFRTSEMWANVGSGCSARGGPLSFKSSRHCLNLQGQDPAVVREGGQVRSGVEQHRVVG
jgi:hypothetical protein